MPRRIRNWDNAVVKWATELRGKKFVWGQTDCVSNLRAMLEVMYGEPIAPEWAYDSLDAAKAVEQASGGVLPVLLSLGAVALKGPAYANTGDVLIDILRPGDLFRSTLPVIGDKILFADPDHVLVLVPLRDAPNDVTAYRLPHGW
jgi:Domain of unknown function (DUF6950)